MQKSLAFKSLNNNFFSFKSKIKEKKFFQQLFTERTKEYIYNLFNINKLFFFGYQKVYSAAWLIYIYVRCRFVDYIWMFCNASYNGTQSFIMTFLISFLKKILLIYLELNQHQQCQKILTNNLTLQKGYFFIVIVCFD